MEDVLMGEVAKHRGEVELLKKISRRTSVKIMKTKMNTQDRKDKGRGGTYLNGCD